MKTHVSYINETEEEADEDDYDLNGTFYNRRGSLYKLIKWRDDWNLILVSGVGSWHGTQRTPQKAFGDYRQEFELVTDLKIDSISKR